jgi:hypothetical protein
MSDSSELQVRAWMAQQRKVTRVLPITAVKSAGRVFMTCAKGAVDAAACSLLPDERIATCHYI